MPESRKTTRGYPFPQNEAQRLETVYSYSILDTPPEMNFDALTRLASYSLNTPAAVIGLMDSDRLWFKSCLGLDVPQLDRQIAFCAHAILQPGQLLIVQNLLQDSRFCANPLVIRPPHLRFYAGAPLVDPNGHVLGTIAVVDSKPREFGEAHRSVLQDLATLAMTALENHRRAIQLSMLALTDHLTGMANRVEFDRALQSEMAHAEITGESFFLLLMDLDGFKDINDRHGHAAGDEVLREVARRLSKHVRMGDVLARLGGDEFGAVMRTGSQEPNEALAQRIAQAVSAPFKLPSGEALNIGISVGLASYSKDIASAAALLAQADEALYRNKGWRRRRS